MVNVCLMNMTFDMKYDPLFTMLKFKTCVCMYVFILLWQSAVFHAAAILRQKCTPSSMQGRLRFYLNGLCCPVLLCCLTSLLRVIDPLLLQLDIFKLPSEYQVCMCIYIYIQATSCNRMVANYLFY